MLIDKAALCAGVAACAMALGSLSGGAHAQPRLTLPSAGLADSLNALSRAAGVQILADPALLDGRKAPAVQGAASPEAALNQLLRGTGLSYEKRGDAYLIIRPASKPVTLNTARGEEVERIAASDRDQGSVETLIVTGTRIARPELESAMPIGVVDMQQAENHGETTVYDALLRDVAVAPGSLGPYYNAAESQYDGGMAAIDLRNLGANRSLTLIDGRRRVSGAASSSAVDINMVPAGMVDHIEIVTGGAAAVYGADAVTGAANIITKKNFKGLEFSITKGVSEQGDGSKTEASITGGATFADGRGSIMLGGTVVKNDPIHYSDRAYAQHRVEFETNPANKSATDGIPDKLIYYDVGNMYLSPYPNFTIGTGKSAKTYLLQKDGSAKLGGFDTYFTTGELALGDGGDAYSLYADDFLRAPIQNASFLGRLNYEITPAVRFGLDFDYGRSRYVAYRHLYREDSRTTWLNGAAGAVAYLDNPYLPDSFRQIMLANGLTKVNLDRSYENLGPITDRSDRTSVTISPELSGKLPFGWRWEAFWQYGQSTNDITEGNIPIASRWIAARDVIADPATGQPECRDAAARAAGCVPLNIFSFDALTPEQRAYMIGTRYIRRQNTQTIWGGNINGSLFKAPAGEVQAVLGFEKRKETVNNIDDPLASPAYGKELSHTASWAPYQPSLEASSSVSEVFTELMVPVLKDLPLVRRLSVEGAYRYSDYSNYESTSTWKAGGNWTPFEGLTFRAVRSRSVRVPNFGELYAAQATGPFNPADPCTAGNYDQTPTRAANCAAILKQLGISAPLSGQVLTAVSLTGGNPDLQPETSNSLTLGVVWQPTFIRGFDVTVDYWKINLQDIITTLSTTNVMNLCVDLPSIDNPFCPRVERGADGYVTQVNSTTVNASSEDVRGVDIGANYRFGLGEGRVTLSFRGSILLQQELTTLPGVDSSIVVYTGDYAHPRFHATVSADYDIDRWKIGLDTTYRGRSLYDANVKSAEQYDNNQIPARIYNDLSVGFRVNEKFTLRAGINNIFDVEPPYYPGAYLGAGYYDVYGRYFFVNAKARFQ